MKMASKAYLEVSNGNPKELKDNRLSSTFQQSKGRVCKTRTYPCIKAVIIREHSHMTSDC
jgi:hypothetical protein